MDDRYEMMNCMIANTLIKNDASTYKIYEQIKKESSQFLDENKIKIYSPKDWHRKYINIKIQKNDQDQEI